jgi:hypothetical protein
VAYFAAAFVIAAILAVKVRERRLLRNGRWHCDGYRIFRFASGQWEPREMTGAVRNAVGIRDVVFPGNMKLSFQAARSIG